MIELRNKYYPIEMDINLKESEKIPHMIEWWESAHQAIVDCGIHKYTLEKTVKESRLVLRLGGATLSNSLAGMIGINDR
ncbi:unnamed protein product [Trichobilharzia regenti]|nr:unnamed protein product [Trichobilharzia regenti]